MKQKMAVFTLSCFLFFILSGLLQMGFCQPTDAKLADLALSIKELNSRLNDHMVDQHIELMVAQLRNDIAWIKGMLGTLGLLIVSYIGNYFFEKFRGFDRRQTHVERRKG